MLTKLIGLPDTYVAGGPKEARFMISRDGGQSKSFSALSERNYSGKSGHGEWFISHKMVAICLEMAGRMPKDLQEKNQMKLEKEILQAIFLTGRSSTTLLFGSSLESLRTSSTPISRQRNLNTH